MVNKTHLIPVKIAGMKKTTDSKCCQGFGEIGTPTHYWWDFKMVKPLWKTVCRFHQKLKIKLPYDTAIPPLGIYPK